MLLRMPGRGNDQVNVRGQTAPVGPATSGQHMGNNLAEPSADFKLHIADERMPVDSYRALGGIV